MGKQSHVGIWNRAEVRAATQALLDLRSDILQSKVNFSLRTRELRASQRDSAINLIHYLPLRGHDLRQLQKNLSDPDAAHILLNTPINLPPQMQFLTPRPGDTLMLTRTLEPGRPATFDQQGRLLSPATVSLTLPEAFNQAREGEPIWFDDGKIGSIIRTVDHGFISVETTHAPAAGCALETDKGVNLPDSELHLPALTDRDQQALGFIAKHADLVGFDGHRRQ